ncbi:TMV resistance protein N-like isoform X1 [Solanum tuberosum]|uniref:TMV resistance protein N n=1 Tax=Solanum tuberosum TaxID=4113 RepID=M1BK04_SOLTU|nr:PREDICTED: TMV resistance protein N-like isoform X1 [Solanum tuberosum]
MSQFAFHAFLSLATKTGKSFGNHLHSALSNAGIRAFSVDELDIDEKGCKELQKTIQESRILIVVLSKDYTSSERCLDELVFILESKKLFGRFVLPVFYDVDPSEVRKQKGSFEQDFLMYEQRYRSGTEERRLEWLQKVKEWKASLTEVADLGGMVLQNQSDGCESRFIQEIVKVVAGRLNRAVLSVALHPVGIDSRVKDINLWLQDGSTSVDIMAIYGMGGLGKSTLAKTAYNLNFDKFDGSSFLADVNKTSERYDGLVSLQRQLLSNVLGKKVEKIYNVDEGVIKIQEAIHCRRILLVLDDVDDRDQLNAVLGMREWFYPGSKIIITTRNQHLFDASEVCSCKMYKVMPLNAQESIRLFSWHAFGKEKPSEDHEDLSEKVILHCKGTPLALKVLGSSLCDRSIEVWESALRKLKAIPDNKILEKLRISYDLLPDDDDVQKIFLDIVCFFVGKDRDYAVTILDGCGFFSVVGIQILSDRCLIEMDKDKLKMHSLIQDMGREIIRLESPWEPQKRSRVWRYRDSFNILSTKTGTENIEGLVLDKGMSNKLSKAVKSVRSYFFSEDAGPIGHGYPRKRRKHLEHFDDASTEGSDSIEFEADAFSRMQRLRILQLSYVSLTGFYSLFPKGLRLLCWSGFHMKIIPEYLPIESLVALEMKKSYLEKAWEGIKILRSLKILNLSHSHFLKRTPDFSGLPHLKTLILKDCIKLVKIHESIGCLDGLVYLNLRDCKNLRKLPGSLCKLKSLEKLIISGCSRLVTSAIELGKLESLTTLQADGMNFGQLAPVGGNMNSWSALWKTWSSKLRRSPGSNQFSFSSLSSSLVSLSLSSCNLTDDALSFGLSNLPSLCFLNLSENLIYNLPQSIKNLGKLQDLWLDGCQSLLSLPELPSSLVKLKAVRCSSLETVTNLPNLMTTLFLDVMESESLTEISGIFKLKPIDNFEVEILNALRLLLNLDNTFDTVVEIFNRFTKTKRMYSVQQGLYEFGIFSTYFPGNEVPSWFSNKSEQRLLTLYVDSLPNIKITGLLICIVYARSSPRIFSYFSKFVGSHTIDIKVQNITQGLKWIYAPSFIGIPGENNKLTFLCHWKFGKYLQTGDQINVSLPCWGKTFKMKEFGATLAYNNPDLDQSSASTSETRVLATRHTPLSDYQSEESVMEGFMPLYQLAVHHYYLSHPEYYVMRDNADFVVRAILNEKLFEDYDVQTAGSGAEEEDDDDSIFDYDEDEDEEAALAELEELLERSW